MREMSATRLMWSEQNWAEGSRSSPSAASPGTARVRSVSS